MNARKGGRWGKGSGESIRKDVRRDNKAKIHRRQRPFLCTPNIASLARQAAEREEVLYG